MLQHGKRPTIASRHGMVAAAHPLAAAAGARVLSNGGNAFDAAAATAATLNVVEPYMSGLAGEGYATCYVAAVAAAASNALPPLDSTRAPAAAAIGCAAATMPCRDAMVGRLPC